MPSGISYNEVEEIIDQIALTKARQYRKIGYYDADDIKQEVKIKCWSVLPKFNPSLGHDIRIFLSICGDNRLRDIKRSILYKHNFPCMQCPFWNQAAASSGIHDCLVFFDKMECEKFVKHERYVQAKLSASHPIDINNERIEDEQFNKKIEGIDFLDHVYTNLPSGLWSLFDKLKMNNYNLSSLKTRERIIMIAALRVALGEYRRV